MKNVSYDFIMDIVSRDNIKLSKLEKIFLDNLKQSNIDLSDVHITDLANKFYISNSTITRFSQKLGFDGFLELKYAIQNIDSSYDYITQIRYTSIIQNLEPLDEETTDFIKNLDKFNKIVIIGIGTSGLMANEFIYKLGELGIHNTDYAKEPYKIDMLAESLDEDDLLICLSLSGQNSNICKAAKTASKNNTSILSITGGKNSTLQELSTKTILIPNYSDYQYSISKAFPILIYIDIICEIISRRKQD